MRRFLKHAAILAHRWLGVCLALLFLMWFLSGIVLVFVDHPRLTPAERFAGLAPIDPVRCCAPLPESLAAARITSVRELRLAMNQGVPVYRVLPDLPGARWIAIRCLARFR